MSARGTGLPRVPAKSSKAAEPLPPSLSAVREVGRTEADLGNLALQDLIAGRLLAKLEVGGASDPEEREADALATSVMAGAGPCSCGGSCPKCSGSNGGAILRRKADGRGAAPLSVARAFNGRGRPLDGATRQRFEPQFGTSLSHIRLHDDTRAASMAATIGARAFAAGNDIGFAKGEFSPNSSSGRQLLAHEISHVVLGHGGQHREPTIRRFAPEDALGASMTPAAATAMSNADLQLTHGLLQARVAGLGPNDPERPAAEGNAAIVSAEATRRNLTLTRPSDAGANPVTGEVASVPVVFVAEEITPFPTSIMPPDPQPGPPGPWPEAPGPAPLPVPWADSAAPTGGSTLATLGMSSHMFAMGEHSWISAEQSFSTMFGRNYWSSMVPRTGTMLADRALNTLPRDLYPILQTTLEGGAVDASRLASMTSMAADHGIAMSDLMRTPELIQRFNSGAATLEEVAILRRIANLHIGATTRDSPLVSYMVPEAPVPGVGARQFRVRVEVPRNQVLDVSAPNSRAALHGMENVEEAEFILSMNHQGRIVNVQTIPPGGVSPGTSFSTRAASFAARNAGAIRWAGRIALVAGLALSGYRIATAAPEERGRVIGQEAGGLALGIVGTAAGAATCIALGVATAGFGLLLCGLAGGAAMGALGSAAGGGIGEFVQGSIKTVKQAAEEIGRSPGSLLAPGLVTPLVFRGGYGGLLRYGGQR